ncbi:hypothetical protein A6A12_0190 [Vibrio anguillarum]|uniref:hypothetical protein n=2 Tax=Vibrio anguillarum TaxID=55601 RepID=UPI000304F2F7|nr:hypothetical protein [Vibrio anguillarum]ARV26771.1 hypothetical protein A6A12_0190 [Vibrio anguillarum]
MKMKKYLILISALGAPNALNLWRRRQAADDQTAEGGSQNFRIEITIPNFQLQLQE